MFDHSNIVPHHSLNKITDALDGIQLGDTPNEVQASALKLLAVRYRKTNVNEQAMINLWLMRQAWPLLWHSSKRP